VPRSDPIVPDPDVAPSAQSTSTLLEIDVVAKLGGGVLAHVEQFSAALAVIAAAATARRLLVVPGGGPFADTVRALERRLPLADDAAHWMAVLGMEQFAHVIATQLPGGVLVDGPSPIAAALAANRVPVLAPYRWMRAADPLPHSWDVTSDSIAAWIAGAVGARRLVLVKPPGAERGDLVDAYFDRALPDRVSAVIVAADRLDRFAAALRGPMAE
jgi:5-(aminomethyl)-3-furanmethanol phosphate kinase